jgi:hypothetical protein
MTPTNGTPATKTVQKTVFDLQKFDDVLLKKEVTLPPPVQSVEDALAAVGNDASKLLSVINAGLEDLALNQAREDMNGFRVVDAEGELGEVYSGRAADEETGKKINAAVLTIAKLNGYEKSLSPEKKAAIKAKSIQFFRDNPAMLGSIAGAVSTTEAPTETPAQ